MKRKFYDTRFAQYAGLEAQLPRVLKYTVTNQDLIFSSEELVRMILSTRSILKTPMAMLLEHLISSSQLANFAALYVSYNDTSIPELLTAGNITLDLKQVPDPQQLASLPRLRDKVLINLTSHVRRESDGQFTIVNNDEIPKLIVRGQLVASYWDNDDWPSPYVAEFAIKSYSMILSAMISRYYSLSLSEQLRIRAILAFYMAQWMTGEGYDSGHPPLFMKSVNYGTHGEVEAIANMCNEAYPNGLDIDAVADLIVKSGPEKLRNFNTAAFSAICGNLGEDMIISKIGLEYPPYWIYMLVAAMSGTKTPLVYQLNSERLINEGRSKWLNALLVDSKIAHAQR